MGETVPRGWSNIDGKWMIIETQNGRCLGQLLRNGGRWHALSQARRGLSVMNSSEERSREMTEKLNEQEA